MWQLYLIENAKNNKVYVGISRDFRRRWSRHLRQLRAGNHHSIKLQRSWELHGSEAFDAYVIDESNDRDEAEQLEIAYIEIFDSIQNGYNVSEGGNQPPVKFGNDNVRFWLGKPSTFRGKTHTVVAKKAMSDAKQGRYIGDKNPMFNHQYSDETREKMRKVKEGIFDGEKNPMFGRKHSEEAKRKIGEASKQRAALKKQKDSQGT